MTMPALVTPLPAFCVAVPAWHSSSPCCSPRAPTSQPTCLPSLHHFHLRRVLLSALPSSSSPAEDFRPADGPFCASSDPLLPSTNQGLSDVEVNPKENIAQSALERAMAYKRMKAISSPNFSSSSSSSQPHIKPPPPVPPVNPGKVEIVVGTPIQSRKSLSSSADDASANPDTIVGGGQSTVPGQSNFARKVGDGKDEGLIAKQLELPQAKSATTTVEQEQNVVEIEIHTRDGIVRRKVVKPETAFANVKDIKRTGVSTLDFVGLSFADKKSSTSRPAGLNESFEAPSGPLPEVEMLTRDAGVANPDAMVDTGDVYKPRVTTWGVFPRPADISKAYGGGRNIKPGQRLETEEEKLARETKTKKLLDDYKKKLGLDMAPKDKARCERTMKNGESLMDRGQLREAQVAFMTVMGEMPFPSELHGMAALQEAVCLDSLNRSDEAKVKYEKLAYHPNGAVRKKARQLLFGFQAAERLKIRAGYNWDSSSYRKYFDAFADGYNAVYKKSLEESVNDEESLMQTLPYALLFIFPAILVLTLVALKHA